MTEIKQLKCPSCGGLVTAPPAATRVTCPYCSATLAVDLDTEEALVYTVDQEGRSKEMDRLAVERSQLYDQYRSLYNEAQSVDNRLSQLEIGGRNRFINAQLRQLYKHRSELGKALSLTIDQITQRDKVLHPEIVTQLPMPPPRQPKRSLPFRLIAFALLLLIAALYLSSVAGRFGIGQFGTEARTSDGATPRPIRLLPTTPTGEIAAPPSSGYFYAKETSHSVTLFASTFQELGGVATLGFPITQAFIEQDPQDQTGRWVQYFEKGVLEYHGDLPEGTKYQLARLGAWLLGRKYPQGVPAAAQLPGTDSHKFNETGFTVTDPFLSYWHHGGELRRFGYPVSPSFLEQSEADGKARIVQYFERAVMEYHPDEKSPFNVQIEAVGTLRLKQIYPTGAPMQASEPVPDSRAP